MLRRRNKQTIKKMEKNGENIREKLKKQELEHKEKQKEVNFTCRNKDKVLQIINHWELIGRPKYRLKNDKAKSFKESVSRITKAFDGKLYLDTIWEKQNQTFTCEGIIEAITKFNDFVRANPTSYLKKTKLHDFFLPNPYIKTETTPLLLEYYATKDKKEGIKPICDFTAKYVTNRYKSRFKTELSHEEEQYLHLLVNKVEEATIHPFYVKRSSDVYAVIPPCRYSPIGNNGKKIKIATFRSGKQFDYVYEIAFDLISNYKENMKEGKQEINNKGLRIVKDSNFIKKINQRINWIRAVNRGEEGHPKYSFLPSETFKDLT